RDLRTYRHLVVRESDTRRATRLSIDTAQRWTVSGMSMSIIAARMGFGFGWFSEDKIRDELAAGLLKALPMREGTERFVDLYLVYADRENAGPGTRRLAEVLRETVAGDCVEATRLLESTDRAHAEPQAVPRRPPKRAKP